MPDEASLSDLSLDFPEDFATALARVPAARGMMTEAMRFAADVEARPLRCRRKDCRHAGFCQFVFDRNGGGRCGADFDIRTVEKAALVLAFLVRLGRPETDSAEGDRAIAPAPASAR
jgi:hypothetical protein